MASNKKWSKFRRVSELMTRKYSKYHEIRQSLLSLNILGDLPAFNTRKYTPREYYNIFEHASIKQMSIKQTSLMKRFKGGWCPSPEQVMKCCRGTTPERMTEFVNLALKSQFNALSKSIQQQFKKSGMFIIDFHQDCYYGNNDNPHVRKSKTKKSTNQFYEYLTADLYSKRGNFTIAIVHRPLGSSIDSLVSQLLDLVRDVISLKTVLFDGEFDSVRVLKLFEQEGLNYLGRKSRTPRIKMHLQVYSQRENWKESRQWHQIEMLSKRKRKKVVMVDICPQDVHGKMKVLVKSPGWNISPSQADKLYKKRFSIETGYRDKHKIQLFTCTKSLTTRLLIMLVSVQLWNCWQCFLVWIKCLKTYSGDLPRGFLIQCTLNWIMHYMEETLLFSYITNQRK